VDDASRELVRGAVGPITAVEDRSWPHGVTRVWRVEVGREVVWVKVHSQDRKYAQEDRAYSVVAPALATAGYRVPARIASDGSRRLVLTDLPGDPARPDDVEIHRQAGAALAEALAARLQRWMTQGRGRVEEELLAEVAARFADPSTFVGVSGSGPGESRRRWCHRDWSARNWLVDRGRIGILDFEHTGPDLWLFDLVRLYETSFVDRPAVEGAFFEGYGPVPEGTGERLAQLLWLTELGTVVWSTAHADSEYLAIGRATLARLRAGWEPRIGR
jgi:Ser/Thr protein kinase RdoA (MazF antagonist)